MDQLLDFLSRAIRSENQRREHSNVQLRRNDDCLLPKDVSHYDIQTFVLGKKPLKLDKFCNFLYVAIVHEVEQNHHLDIVYQDLLMLKESLLCLVKHGFDFNQALSSERLESTAVTFAIYRNNLPVLSILFANPHEFALNFDAFSTAGGSKYLRSSIEIPIFAMFDANPAALWTSCDLFRQILNFTSDSTLSVVLPNIRCTLLHHTIKFLRSSRLTFLMLFSITSGAFQLLLDRAHLDGTGLPLHLDQFNDKWTSPITFTEDVKPLVNEVYVKIGFRRAEIILYRAHAKKITWLVLKSTIVSDLVKIVLDYSLGP